MPIDLFCCFIPTSIVVALYLTNIVSKLTVDVITPKGTFCVFAINVSYYFKETFEMLRDVREVFDCKFTTGCVSKGF